MSGILILFVVGVALLALDVFASSFLLALGGAGVMAVAAGVAYRDFGPAAAGAAALAALVLLALTIYLEIVVLPRTRFGRGLVVHSTTGTAQAPLAVAADVVGREAAALTTLAPSGYVLVDGKRYEAFCTRPRAPRCAWSASTIFV
jgi:membrane-bound ClpP family serine protease